MRKVKGGIVGCKTKQQTDESLREKQIVTAKGVE
jgi:hypothetical protein